MAGVATDPTTTLLTLASHAGQRSHQPTTAPSGDHHRVCAAVAEPVNLLSFVGSSLFALAWISGYVFVTPGHTGAARVALIVVWLIGLGATLLSFVLLTHKAAGFRRT